PNRTPPKVRPALPYAHWSAWPRIGATKSTETWTPFASSLRPIGGSGMRVHLLLGLVAFRLVAQPPLKPEDYCTLEGRVLNAATGTPLAKTTLVLMRTSISANVTALPPDFTTNTDGEGRFAMRDIEPGQYRLRASRAGFIDMEYGSRGPFR